ncbi:hypothetical protein SK128_018879, partial [Halocaridina rubra]
MPCMVNIGTCREDHATCVTCATRVQRRSAGLHPFLLFTQFLESIYQELFLRSSILPQKT